MGAQQFRHTEASLWYHIPDHLTAKRTMPKPEIVTCDLLQTICTNGRSATVRAPYHEGLQAFQVRAHPPEPTRRTLRVVPSPTGAALWCATGEPLQIATYNLAQESKMVLAEPIGKLVLTHSPDMAAHDYAVTAEPPSAYQNLVLDMDGLWYFLVQVSAAAINAPPEKP